jgi:hypothetical protein
LRKSFLVTAGLILSLSACSSTSPSSGSGPSVIPGRAAIQVEVVPNPIQARQISGDTYEFPFNVVVRELNGVAVQINRVSVDVRALGAIRIYNDAYDSEKIRQLGYSTSVAAGSEQRYTFSTRREVSDDRLFGGVSAELRVDATDANGNAVTASTDVTISR